METEQTLNPKSAQVKKRTETNVEKLKNQRRLNVQEQLILKKNAIENEAKYWRENGIPSPVIKIFEGKGINFNTSIILDYEQDYPGINTDEGIVLTEDGEFFQFEADLNSTRSELIELYAWTNITTKYKVEDHKKGVGKTHGQLAMEVLTELNNK